MYRQPSLACGTEPKAPTSTSLPAAPAITRGCHGLDGTGWSRATAIGAFDAESSTTGALSSGSCGVAIVFGGVRITRGVGSIIGVGGATIGSTSGTEAILTSGCTGAAGRAAGSLTV